MAKGDDRIGAVGIEVPQAGEAELVRMAGLVAIGQANGQRRGVTRYEAVIEGLVGTGDEVDLRAVRGRRLHVVEIGQEDGRVEESDTDLGAVRRRQAPGLDAEPIRRL